MYIILSVSGLNANKTQIQKWTLFGQSEVNRRDISIILWFDLNQLLFISIIIIIVI